jgi:hypothetical protein
MAEEQDMSKLRAQSMGKKASSFSNFCSSIDFGEVTLSGEEKLFYDQLKQAIMRIIKSLPLPVQTDAMLELMGHLKLPLNRDVDFLKAFYPPTWTILYWLYITFDDGSVFSKRDIQNYCTIHSAAMLLHLIDDHLVDGDMPATHQVLLLRSQLWVAMNHALNAQTRGKDRDFQTARKYLDTYYASVGNAQGLSSLNAYCLRFKQQMGMGFIAPVLMTKKITVDVRLSKAVETLFGAFGTAWRLLDDLQDIPTDILKRTRSSVYICLPEKIKRQWCSKRPATISKVEHTELIFQSIIEQNIIERLISRICQELNLASSIADSIKIQGYASELNSLEKSLKSLTFDELKC